MTAQAMIIENEQSMNLQSKIEEASSTPASSQQKRSREKEGENTGQEKRANKRAKTNGRHASAETVSSLMHQDENTIHTISFYSNKRDREEDGNNVAEQPASKRAKAAEHQSSILSYSQKRYRDDNENDVAEKQNNSKRIITKKFAAIDEKDVFENAKRVLAEKKRAREAKEAQGTAQQKMVSGLTFQGHTTAYIPDLTLNPYSAIPSRASTRVCPPPTAFLNTTNKNPNAPRPKPSEQGKREGIIPYPNSQYYSRLTNFKASSPGSSCPSRSRNKYSATCIPSPPSVLALPANGTTPSTTSCTQ